MLGGDLIVAIDGQQKSPIRRTSAQMLNGHRAGDTVTVTIYRGRKRMDIRLTLGEAGDVQA